MAVQNSVFREYFYLCSAQRSNCRPNVSIPPYTCTGKRGKFILGPPMMQEIIRKITNATNILIRVPYSSKFSVLVQASSSSSSHSSISSSPFFSTVSINSWAELSTRAAMCLCSAWSCRRPSLYLYVRNRSDSSFSTIKTTHHYVFVSKDVILYGGGFYHY